MLTIGVKSGKRAEEARVLDGGTGDRRVQAGPDGRL
jgi:hypothetical protein